jgi:glutamate 5-kinase
MDNLRHGHARRVQLVGRIETAAARMIGGDSIDAAAAGGFKARLRGGKINQQAGVQLARAARA